MSEGSPEQISAQKVEDVDPMISLAGMRKEVKPEHRTARDYLFSQDAQKRHSNAEACLRGLGAADRQQLLNIQESRAVQSNGTHFTADIEIPIGLEKVTVPIYIKTVHYRGPDELSFIKEWQEKDPINFLDHSLPPVVREWNGNEAIWMLDFSKLGMVPIDTRICTTVNGYTPEGRQFLLDYLVSGYGFLDNKLLGQYPADHVPKDGLTIDPTDQFPFSHYRTFDFGITISSNKQHSEVFQQTNYLALARFPLFAPLIDPECPRDPILDQIGFYEQLKAALDKHAHPGHLLHVVQTASEQIGHETAAIDLQLPDAYTIFSELLANVISKNPELINFLRNQIRGDLLTMPISTLARKNIFGRIEGIIHNYEEVSQEITRMCAKHHLSIDQLMQYLSSIDGKSALQVIGIMEK